MCWLQKLFMAHKHQMKNIFHHLLSFFLGSELIKIHNFHPNEKLNGPQLNIMTRSLNETVIFNYFLAGVTKFEIVQFFSSTRDLTRDDIG